MSVQDFEWTMQAHAGEIVRNYQELVEDKMLHEELPPRLFVIMRGLPGSRKTTLAEAITYEAVRYNMWSVICWADHYFQRNGSYQFDAALLGEAHQSCCDECRTQLNLRLAFGVDIVIVDNTNIRREDFDRYWNLPINEVQRIVVSFDCPLGPTHVGLLGDRAARNARNIPGRVLQELDAIWRMNYLDRRNGHHIDLDEFFNERPSERPLW